MVLGLICAAMCSLPAAVSGQGCEPPLFVIQSNSGANVMILMDNSGSMNEAIYHEAYDPTYDYSGRFSTDRMYYISRSKLYSQRSFRRGWPRNPKAYLVRSDNGRSGRYIGNYLNWIFSHATEEQRENIPRTTRIQVGKQVMIDLVNRIDPGIRLGLTVFQPNNTGGNVIGNCGSNPNSLIEQINGISANTWTPLGEALETLVDYFSNDLPSAPIQNACQMNFIIVCTDGFPTMDVGVSQYLHDADGDGNDPGNCQSIGAPDHYGDWDCSDHMDDVAYFLRTTDLRPDLGDPDEVGEEGQNCYTYTIGFMIDAPLLLETAVNGGGLYYSANDAAELADAFDMAMQDILMRMSAGSSVAVVSTERGDENTLYRGKFMPGSWDGYMEAFSLPYDDGDDPYWEGGLLLRERVAYNDDRDIFTAMGSDRYDFDPDEAGDLREAMDVDDVNEAADLIEWARGHDVLGYRDRDGWVLGDIVHSAPIVVGAPSHFSTDEDYQEFMESHANRQKVVYVGANDGMLHAFHADSGQEIWAFVPEFALPKFQVMADSSYCHTYTCDLTPSVDDVRLNSLWRTVLVGGGRMGGASYFCLDITDPYSPTVLWQEETPDGYPFPSEVTMTSIDGEAVVLAGSGFDTDSEEAWIHVYSLEDGDRYGSRQLSNLNSGRNKATKPAVVDRDLDGEADVVFVADLDGSVWRGEVNGLRNPSSWTWTEFFSCNQVITAAPTVAYGDGDKYHVYFGTGVYLEEDDFDNADVNSFYCVYDRGEGATLDPGDLADQTGSPGDIGEADGWYVNLIEHGEFERVTETAVVVAGIVYFTAFTTNGDECSAGGRSWLYGLAYEDGGNLEDEDGEEIPSCIELPGGIASQPVADIVEGTVVIQATDASITVEEISQQYFHLTVRSWQETFDVENIQ